MCAADDLRAAWAGLIARARANRHHLVTREQLSVRSEMSRLLKMLQPARFVEFTALFAEHADIAHLSSRSSRCSNCRASSW